MYCSGLIESLGICWCFDQLAMLTESQESCDRCSEGPSIFSATLQELPHELGGCPNIRE
jgi:hypothetical protein